MMGIKQQCEVLELSLSQSLEILIEAQYRAKNLLEYSPDDIVQEISYILELCDDGLIQLKKSASEIELLQSMIGHQSTLAQKVQVNLGVNNQINPVNSQSNPISNQNLRTSEDISGETSSTKLGKEIHA